MKVISGLNSGKRKKEIQVLGKFSKHSRDLAMNIVYITKGILQGEKLNLQKAS